MSSRVSSSHKPFARLSSASETFLWDFRVRPEFASDGPVAAFEGACSAAFDERCQHVFHAGSDTPGTASLYDIAAGRDVSRFFAWDEDGSKTRTSRRAVSREATSARRFADVDFGPPGTSLVLWGHTLWDVRLPHPVREFDAFSDGGGACFHPRGDEVVLNSSLGFAQRAFVAQRARVDGCKPRGREPASAAWRRTARPGTRASSPPFGKASTRCVSAFRAVDGERDYAEIATVDVDRACSTPPGTPAPTTRFWWRSATSRPTRRPDAAVRVYEAGRLRPSEEDSDAEDAADSGDGRSEDDGDYEFFFGDEERDPAIRAAGLLDDAALAAMRDDDDDDDDDAAAARTAAAIAGDGAALAGLRALLGGLVADRIRALWKPREGEECGRTTSSFRSSRRRTTPLSRTRSGPPAPSRSAGFCHWSRILTRIRTACC